MQTTTHQVSRLPHLTPASPHNEKTEPQLCGESTRDPLYDPQGCPLKSHFPSPAAHHSRDGRCRAQGAVAAVCSARHPGSAVSQRERKGIEEVSGWLKTVGLLRKARHRGVARVGWMFTFAAAVYNLVRMRTPAAVA
jgi:hypothetical protein